MVHRRGLLTQMLEVVGVRTILIAINVAYTLGLASLLSAEKYGFLSLAISSALVFLTAANFGSDWKLTMDVAAKREDVSRIFSEYLGTKITLSAIFCTLSILSAFALRRDAELVILISIFSLSIIPRSLLSLHLSALHGLGSANKAVRYEVGVRGAEVLIIFLALYVFGPPLIFIAITNLVVWSCAAAIVWKHRTFRLPSLTPVASTMRVLKRTIPFGVLSTCVMAGMRLPIIAAPNNLAPAHALGWLALSINFLTIGNLFTQSFLPSLTTQLAASSKKGGDFALHLESSIVMAASLSGLIAMLLLDTAGGPIATAIFGSSFAGISRIGLEIGLAFSLTASLTTANTIFGYFNRPWQAVVCVVSGLTTTSALLMVDRSDVAYLLQASCAGWLVTVLGFHAILLKEAKAATFQNQVILTCAPLICPVAWILLQPSRGNLNIGMLALLFIPSFIVFAVQLRRMLRRIPFSN